MTVIYAPGPVNVHPDVIAAAASPMHHRTDAFSSLLGSLRDDIAGLYPAPAETVLIPGSATYALEAAIGSFCSGSRVLVMNNGVYGARLASIGRNVGAEVVESNHRDLLPITEEDVRAAARRTRPGAILLVHNETSTGVLNDVSGAASVARDMGALLVIDDVSSLGSESMTSLRDLHWVSVGTGTKCLESFSGVGTITAPSTTWATRCSSYGFSLDLRRHLIAQRDGTVPFTPVVPAFLALGAALERLREEGGPVARRLRYRTELEGYRARLPLLGFNAEVETCHNSASILLLALPGPQAAAELLSALERVGIVAYHGRDHQDTGHMRVSSMGFHRVDRVETLISGFERVLAGGLDDVPDPAAGSKTRLVPRVPS